MWREREESLYGEELVSCGKIATKKQNKQKQNKNKTKNKHKKCFRMLECLLGIDSDGDDDEAA